jgi:fluoroacetyl-CoA thioesterase
MALAPGERASVQVMVSQGDTAIAAGSGDVPVLSTPRLLALAEAAAVAAVERHVKPPMTTVGTAALVAHRHASPLGTEVVVEAELTRIEGRTLAFSFIARDTGRTEPGTGEHLVVGTGTMERVIVDRAGFLARAARR